MSVCDANGENLVNPTSEKERLIYRSAFLEAVRDEKYFLEEERVAEGNNET